MSFSLPLAGSRVREMLDLASIAEILAPQNIGKLQVMWEARRAARKQFEADPAIKRVVMVVLCASNDERWLVSFGPRGGSRKEWNFGSGGYPS